MRYQEIENMIPPTPDIQKVDKSKSTTHECNPEYVIQKDLLDTDRRPFYNAWDREK